ncbi:hypothetical protein [Micromonospora parathelypteridis]|uniref:GerMN domain-containing protein n=1 Tax=Micromonospora parathelypteridis TaxID=1839617 RepID=A0A840VG86_9ACTN|nr:hypothetical protein [Micromonospora parathelypteridis]MBB5475803.1 hypothetical protein [Micromonospora parathelypteridis]GGO26516.1 hypothetical protein GCM10011576_50150 [Micromonospora parathelypteridis]
MTGRRTGRALLAGALLLTLLAAGCGVRPSRVITGRSAVSGPSVGTGLYLLAQGELVLVLRPAKADASPANAVALLAAGPDDNERGQGLTTEVPVELGPVKVGAGADRSAGLIALTTGAAQPLSANAADQIICTVADAAAQVGLADDFAPVTIVGPDGARPPRPCPIK